MDVADLGFVLTRLDCQGHAAGWATSAHEEGAVSSKQQVQFTEACQSRPGRARGAPRYHSLPLGHELCFCSAEHARRAHSLADHGRQRPVLSCILSRRLIIGGRVVCSADSRYQLTANQAGPQFQEHGRWPIQLEFLICLDSKSPQRFKLKTWLSKGLWRPVFLVPLI